jgi:hypothetical protein
MGWEVADIDATVAALRARGVVFEEYDQPGLKTVNGIADIEGNYPSKGTGERGAWFRDSEGNVLGLASRSALERTSDAERAAMDALSRRPRRARCQRLRERHRVRSDGERQQGAAKG